MRSATHQNHAYEFRLDNAGLIFPSLLSKRTSTIFRLSANIDAPVRLDLLTEALKAMLQRCPYYRVQLRKGLFWYYLEANDAEPMVEAESRYPCLYIPYKKPGTLPFRVLAYRDRVIFEVAHFITDGAGALRFLNSLLLEYFRRRGEKIDSEGMLIDCKDPVDPGEYEDSFHRVYEKGVPPAKKVEPALNLGGTKAKVPVINIVEGSMKSAELKAEAKKHGATIGEFLTALLIDVVQEEMRARKLKPKPIRISIPIDLRRVFGSKTMRNFALTVEPEIDPRLGDFSFDDIIKKVHHFMKIELDHRMILRQIARNIGAQTNHFIRVIPLFIKDPMMRSFYATFGRRAFTLSFSNLGRVQIPEDMQPFVKRYQFLPPPDERAINTTSMAYNGTTYFFFGTTIVEKSLERRFFRRLRKMGIQVSIRTN